MLIVELRARTDGTVGVLEAPVATTTFSATNMSSPPIHVETVATWTACRP